MAKEFDIYLNRSVAGCEAKEFDICLNRGVTQREAKEFSVYLNRRVAECDLIILNLPFQASLRIEDGLILDACIRAYTLYKYAASKIHSEIESHIDEMLKICFEMMSGKTEMTPHAGFTAQYMVHPDRELAICPAVDDVTALISKLNDARSEMVLGIEAVSGLVRKIVGGDTACLPDAKLDETLKTGRLSVESELGIETRVSETDMRRYASAEAELGIGFSIVRLCERVFRAADTAVELSAFVRGTEIHFSFGHAFSGMALGSLVGEASAIKHESAQAGLGLLADEAYTNMRQYTSAAAFVHPEASLVELRQQVFRAANAGIGLSAFVRGTEIHFSFGHAFASTELGFAVEEAISNKYEAASAELGLLTKAAETMTIGMPQKNFGIVLSFAAEAIAKQPRTLSELDEAVLSDWDEATLMDLYYKIIE